MTPIGQELRDALLIMTGTPASSFVPSVVHTTFVPGAHQHGGSPETPFEQQVENVRRDYESSFGSWGDGYEQLNFEESLPTYPEETNVA